LKIPHNNLSSSLSTTMSATTKIVSIKMRSDEKEWRSLHNIIIVCVCQH
jgi:hypothetical protein